MSLFLPKTLLKIEARFVASYTLVVLYKVKKKEMNPKSTIDSKQQQQLQQLKAEDAVDN